MSAGVAPAVDVLVASRDRNFLALARATLRAGGYRVVTTTVVSERVLRQVRLRAPRLVLLEADGSTVQAVVVAAAPHGAQVLQVSDDVDAPRAVGKWAPAAGLLAAVGGALGEQTPQGRPSGHLRVVRS